MDALEFFFVVFDRVIVHNYFNYSSLLALLINYSPQMSLRECFRFHQTKNHQVALNMNCSMCRVTQNIILCFITNFNKTSKRSHQEISPNNILSKILHIQQTRHDVVNMFLINAALSEIAI